MSDLSPQNIRNVALASYPGAGKTTLCEALALTTGAISTMGSVEKGSTVSDFEPEEVRRHSSVSASVLSLSWKGHRLNLIDTPGSLDFFADTRWCLSAVDAVVLVISASTGIRTELERVWDRICELDLPCLLFVNELDKDQTQFDRLLEECQAALEQKVVPVVLPVRTDGQLTGVIDLVHGVVLSSSPASPKLQQGTIPADMESRVAEMRKTLVEHVAETSDALVETYLAEGDLTTDDLVHGVTTAARTRAFLPVCGGAALQNIGTHYLLDAILTFLPSPPDRAATHPHVGIHPQSKERIERHADPTEPFSAFVFKTTIDPFMGRLTFVRVCSGTLEADTGFFNASRNVKEKGGHLFHPLGKKHAQTDRLVAGEIGAIAKLKDTQTGDTICDDKHPVQYPRVVLPRPVMSFALEPKSKGDIDKVSLGLHKLVEEDPSLEFVRNDETKEMLLSGVGQTHIDVTLEKLKRKYGVEVKLNTPKVPYKETIHRTAQAQGKYKKQTGGHGQYGDCWLQVDPLPRGAGFEFHNKIVGGVIPRNFIPAVEKGVVEALQEGVVAGYPVVDLSVTVYDGSHHPVDSSELAFKVAGSLAIKKALESAHPTLLEPMMTVEVTVPDDLVGAVIGDLNGRRGRILGMSAKGHNQVIKACVPLAEMLKYAPALTSMTAGKGSYVMEFSGYEEVPRDLINKIVEDSKREKATVSS